jgi:enoyl-CoA hydratase/carnithine racemase
MLACLEMNDMHKYTLEHGTAKGLTFMSVKTPMFIILFFTFLSFFWPGVAVLTLNRPHVKNAIGQELLSRLRASIESLQFDDSARVLLVRSAVPGVFCAGADLKVLIHFLLFKRRCSCCLHSIGDGLTERDDSVVATGMLFHL